MQEENQKILNSIFKDYACIGHRLFLNDDACTIGEMFITEKYLELIGFPKEKYISYCLRLGYLKYAIITKRSNDLSLIHIPQLALRTEASPACSI